MTERQTMRQQLKLAAGNELMQIVAGCMKVAQDHLDGYNVDLELNDVLALGINERTTTLEEQMVRELANQKEQQLIEMYNDQMGLPLNTEKEK